MTLARSPAEPAPSSTPAPRLDRVVERLASRRRAWVHVPIRRRIEYLRRCIDGVLEVAESWVEEACRRRGIDPASPLAGEEWISGPATTVRQLSLLIEALEQGGQPVPPGPPVRWGERVVVPVFPRTITDRLLYYNVSAEVWLEPGREPTQGRIYRDKRAGTFTDGGLALVLGAGNVSSIAPLDLLYKLFVEDHVVVLKMNPVNAYLGPYLERAFAALIEDGYLALVYGGPAAGDHLCRHPAVDTIHLTGSDRTYDAIVWGADSGERERRKVAGRPVLDKPVTAELGCVTPVLVVPGRWRSSDLEFQARHVASMVAHNASFNCNAAKVLVVARGWPQRELFLSRLRAALAAVPPRQAYYPGALERYAAFRRRYPGAVALSPEQPGTVPWTLIPDVPPRRGEYALEHEAFCGVLAQVSLEAGDVPAYLDRAAAFANDTVWGTLSCVLLADPATQRAHREPLRRAVERLRYGSVTLNAWSAVSFVLGVTSWGAYPGHTREAIGSGRGVVHNAYLFDRPEKSVVRAPFRIRPKPCWFPDHRRLDELGRRLTRFEARRGLGTLVRLVHAGLRG